MMSVGMASVELVRVAKSYGGQAAVDGIDLAIPDGALVCLLGPSGCGKTTTLRLIAGFMSPDAGEIRVGGVVLSSPRATAPPEARRMSMVFQSYALWPHMTVARNVAYGLELRGMAREEVRRRVEEYAFEHNGTLADPTLSIGVATHPEDGATRNDLTHAADEALYRAKRAGGNTVGL